MVAFSLIEHMVRQIDRGKITCKAAAKKLSRMCDCGIFNTGDQTDKMSCLSRIRSGIRRNNGFDIIVAGAIIPTGLLERMTPDRPQ